MKSRLVFTIAKGAVLLNFLLPMLSPVFLGKSWTMKVESVTVANREVQVTNGDDNFSEFFRFNQIGASDICKLVAKIYNNQVVELPADIGEFYLEKTKSTLRT